MVGIVRKPYFVQKELVQSNPKCKSSIKQKCTKVMGIAMDENTKKLVASFKSWCDFQGYLHAAKELGHNSTRTVERWYNEGKIPECKVVRVRRILKQEGYL